MDGLDDRMIGELLIIAAQVAFAVGILFTKKLTVGTNPFLVTSLVALIGALVMLPILFYFSKEVKLFTQQKLIWAVLAGIFWIAVGELLYISGLSKITISNASLLALTFPIFATVLGIIFLGETISLKFIFASLLMIAGYFLLVI